MTTERIPFDLERALAGHALVTRSGRKVTNFRCGDADDADDVDYPYKATILTEYDEPIDELFTGAGRFYISTYNESPNDLFMAENASKPRYMVSVEGRKAPRVVHDSKASAVTEAERLMNSGAGDVIRVLRVEKVLRRKVTTEWGDE